MVLKKIIFDLYLSIFTNFYIFLVVDAVNYYLVYKKDDSILNNKFFVEGI